MPARGPALLAALVLLAAPGVLGTTASAATSAPGVERHAAAAPAALAALAAPAPAAVGVPVGDLAPQQRADDGAGAAVVMQGDGNLVLYRAGRPAWHTSTAGNPGARLVRQGDGNLVVLSREGRPLWSSGTDGLGATDLRLRDGRLGLAHPSGRLVWQDGAFLGAALVPGQGLAPGDRLRSPRRGYDLRLQADGNLVLARTGGGVVWSSRTDGTGADRLVLQGDGNLVLTDGGSPRWHTTTAGTPGARLVLQDDGNLVLLGSGRPRWDSRGVTGTRARYLLPAFAATVHPVTAAGLGTSYRAGCPVGPASLRLLRLSYVDLEGRAATGELVVHADVADGLARVFRRLYELRSPVQRMVPVTVYGSSDDASMAAGNTSGFNCRPRTGGTAWSEHSYGRALDLNPVQNPYVSGTTVLPPAGRAFTDRSVVRPGMVTPAVVSAFAAEGWSWGGSWTSSKDYQHFSTTGR